MNKEYRQGQGAVRSVLGVCLLVLALMLMVLPVDAQVVGMPYIRNFLPSEYGAHSRNSDVVCSDNGTVFIANFEGLLYYEGADWRKIHTPGISRVTRLAKDGNGRIWVGGYNFFGYIIADEKGRLTLKSIVSDNDSQWHSEVDDIIVDGDRVKVHVANGSNYYVKDEQLVPQENADNSEVKAELGPASILNLPEQMSVSYAKAPTPYIQLNYMGKQWCTLTEDDGLVSNIANKMAFDNHHSVWGVTDKGVFMVSALSPYTILGDNQGLKGAVNCIGQIGDRLYVGTMEGLYYIAGSKVQKISQVGFSCWQLFRISDDELLAATADGIFKVMMHGVTRVTDTNTLSVCYDSKTDTYLTGEVDGIYRYNGRGAGRTMISKVEKAMRMKVSGNKLTAESVYGELWEIPLAKPGKATCVRSKIDANAPRLEYKDAKGRLWKTDNEGYNISVAGKDKWLGPWMVPLRRMMVNVLFVDKDDMLCMGGDFGLIISSLPDMQADRMPALEKLYVRQVTINGDSVVWGGYQPESLLPVTEVKDIELPVGSGKVDVMFSLKTGSVLNPTQYRFRINGGRWSVWSDEPHVHFNNLIPGTTELELQAMDAFGRLTEVSKVEIYRHFPYYLRWWALVVYVIIVFILIMAFMQWRTRRLHAEKEKLEAVVKERTAELSNTLYELRQTQDDLVRMERTATAGKLTQGLIDRILNPINYINNFSHLTIGLAKDLREDVEDEKDSISEDNYEDCQDILDMMTQNLQKIEQHGVNTTRTLRAMEAMLNMHVGVRKEHDMNQFCSQIVKVVADVHKAEIDRCGIRLELVQADVPALADIDADSMNRVVLSIISNSIYAVAKKYDQAQYEGVVLVKVALSPEGKVQLTVRDNGIGMEDTIKDKIFDPFFTTKPTGDAAGVGLYLVREILNEHKATITVDSVKDEYCEFVIRMS